MLMLSIFCKEESTESSMSKSESFESHLVIY